MKTFAAQATFIFAVAFALPAFAGKEACAAGKSDGQIILDLKNQVDNEWWNDLKIRRNWFGIGVATGSVVTAALIFKYCKNSSR